MTERPNIALMTEAQKEALIMALWQELEHLKQQNAQLKQQHAQDQIRLEQLQQPIVRAGFGDDLAPERKRS